MVKRYHIPDPEKILHLFSNHRWTGPAEPAVNLACALLQTGHDVTFSCGKQPRGRKNGIIINAQKKGLDIRPGLNLKKHLNPLKTWVDSRMLSRWLHQDGFGIVHAHLENAHIVSALAVLRMGQRPFVVRSCYEGDGRCSFRDKYLLQHHTDALLVVSESARQTVVEYGFPSDRVWVVPTAIDLKRFDPKRGFHDRRAEFNINPDDFVVGIVARIQWHRRYNIFLEAIDRARRKVPNLRAVIVGRGSNMKPIVVDPIQKMGLQDIVILPGYQAGDDFVRILLTMDVKVFLVPGTDGSCRAVREAMAMGIPVIAAKRGMLTELVETKKRGLIIDDSAEALSNAIVHLAKEQEKRMEMGASARQYALNHFSSRDQAEKVGNIYEELVMHNKR
ncbi:MAG: glycosyltransferase family 4 protein [Deltaproteobacteria bacterium]|nr:glycosyltransferase family 4 protein [Deltaproteobacteria bacterium]